MDNNLYYSLLKERTTSAFPLSIGTSYAMESLFEGTENPYDPDRKIPNRINLLDYNSFWINLSTLYRNIYSALPKEAAMKANPEILSKILDNECRLIQSIVHQHTYPDYSVMFYLCNYAEYTEIKKVPGHLLRRLTTQIQIAQKDLENGSLKQFLLNNHEHPLKYCHQQIHHYSTDKILMMTHINLDLLSYPTAKSLDLLESHTGLLKKRSLWYTRFHSIKEEVLNTLPFLLPILLVLGDRHMFKPMRMSTRLGLLSISRDQRWTSVTTQAKVKLDVQTYGNPILKQDMLPFM